MSLVGPRPALPEQVAACPAAATERLAALPGITGPRQVSGRADVGFDDVVRLDIGRARRDACGRPCVPGAHRRRRAVGPRRLLTGRAAQG